MTGVQTCALPIYLVARTARQALDDQLPTESLLSDKVQVSGLPTDQLPVAQLLG